MKHFPNEPSPEKYLPTDCKICFFHRTNDTNPIVYCDGCNTSFHKICYGLKEKEIVKDEFYCDLC